MPDAGRLRYSHILLPIKDQRSTRATVEGDHLRIVIDDPANPGEPDEYDLRLRDPEHASLQLVGVPAAAMPFTRHAGPPPVPAADWDSNRIYAVQEEPTTPNAEMASIYDEDQKARHDVLAGRTEWHAVEKADRARRDRVAALLAAGALHTADDYRKAAFVFQHGERPDDYLLAHTLAVVAVVKGIQAPRGLPRPHSIATSSPCMSHRSVQHGRTRVVHCQARRRFMESPRSAMRW